MLTLALLTIPALCSAQAAPPAIVFARSHHDCGAIGPGVKMVFRYPFTNRGGGPLHIPKVMPACGCTFATLAKGTLAPGESSDLEVTFDPAGLHGRIHKSLQVLTDDPVHPSVTLTFEAEVVDDLVPDRTTVLMEDLSRDGAGTASIRFTPGGTGPARIARLKTSPVPWLETGLREVDRDTWLDVRLDGTRVPQTRMDGVEAIQAFSPGGQVLHLEVRWSMHRTVNAVPERLALVLAAGTDQKAALHLRQTQGRPFRVTGFDSSNPGIQVTGIRETAQSEQDLEVQMSGTLPAGAYQECVTLFLDDPGQPTLPVRVSLMLQGADGHVPAKGQ